MMEIEQEIKESLPRCLSRDSDGQQKDPLQVRYEFIQLLEEEGLHQRELGCQYRAVATFLTERGDRGAAEQYAKKALRNDVRCFGKDSPIVQEDVELLSLLRETGLHVASAGRFCFDCLNA